MGRVNFGPEVHDRKGLRGPVRLGNQPLTGWEMYSLPLDSAQLGRLIFKPTSPPLAGPGFYRFEVHLPAVGDTFLDMRT